jgi:hypothetical protein
MKTSTSPLVAALSRNSRMVDAGRGLTAASVGMSFVPGLKFVVIARSPCDEAIHFFFVRQEWIASRSLSSGAHSRDPLARNDG